MKGITVFLSYSSYSQPPQVWRQHMLGTTHWFSQNFSASGTIPSHQANWSLQLQSQTQIPKNKVLWLMFGQKSHSFCVSFTCVNTGPISTTAVLVQRMRQVSSRKRPFVASVIWILCTFILFWGKLLLNNGYPAFYQLQLILLCWNGFSLIKTHSRRCWWP